MTIEEQRKAIIEDGIASGLLDASGSVIPLSNNIAKLTVFAQLQAARNQSNNVPVNEGYEQDVDKAVKAAKKWAKEIPELTDHSPRNAIDTLAVLLLQARAGTSPQQSNALEMAANSALEKAIHLIEISDSWEEAVASIRALIKPESDGK
jgi:hypothetical protein